MPDIRRYPFVLLRPIIKEEIKGISINVVLKEDIEEKPNVTIKSITKLGVTIKSVKGLNEKKMKIGVKTIKKI